MSTPVFKISAFQIQPIFLMSIPVFKLNTSLNSIYILNFNTTLQIKHILEFNVYPKCQHQSSN